MKIVRDASFSADNLHRFTLSRTWDPAKGFALFVGLNPSKAGKNFDDMTVRKGIGFAQRWGLGGTLHGNVFSRISTDPKFIASCVDRVREQTYTDLVRMARWAKVIVLAWGAFKQFRSEFRTVAEILAEFSPKCLGRTIDGFPHHISRIAYSTPLVDWPVQEVAQR